MTPQYLVDTSAVFRLLKSSGASLGWDKPITQGLLGVCAFTELEVLYAARSSVDRAELRRYLETTYPWTVVPDGVTDRAVEVQEMLTEKGQHRSAGPVDLLVAATAELTGRILLHYDRDFELVARVTGQGAQWLAPPGSID